MTRDGRTDAPDDAELLRLAQRDATAFRALYDRHAVRVHDFLLRRTNDPGAAFELTAETFAQAWLSRGRFTDQGHGAAPWLFGIARNLLASSVRARAIDRAGRRRVGLELADSVAAPAEAWLDGLDEELAGALDALPDGTRRAVEMRVLDGEDYGEIGRALDIAPGTARVRVHRGLAALRRLVRPDPPSAPVPVLHTRETPGEPR
jgi:RNA polymerase sigma factor (sigma-70 family)